MEIVSSLQLFKIVYKSLLSRKYKQQLLDWFMFMLIKLLLLLKHDLGL